jgi:hypothetical protein
MQKYNIRCRLYAFITRYRRNGNPRLQALLENGESPQSPGVVLGVGEQGSDKDSK